MNKEVRQKIKLKRKNFLPTLIIIFLLLLFLSILVYFVPPDGILTIITFFILFFLLTLFTFSLLLSNSKIGLIFAIVLTFFLILRMLGVGTLINFILIVAIGIIPLVYAKFKK